MRILKIAALLFVLNGSVEAITGKVDLAPAYIHLDVLEGNQTVKKIDMPAVRLESSIIVYEGWTVKPLIIYGKNNGELASFGVGIGRCIPFREKFLIFPSVGFTYTRLSTSIHLELVPGFNQKYHERFHSNTPYIGLDIYYTICPGMRVCGTFQWGWSRTHTKIDGLVDFKGDSSGPNVGLLYEYDLTECWSVNIGGGYNHSLGNTKDGIRAYGGKIGLARWF